MNHHKKHHHHLHEDTYDNKTPICVSSLQESYHQESHQESQSYHQESHQRHLRIKIHNHDTNPKIQHLQDGSKLFTFQDGRQSQIFPDGVYVSIHSTCKIQINPDGSTIREFHNGDAILTRPDGRSGLHHYHKSQEHPI